MRYIFGAYSLDTQLYELRRAGERLHLGPQVFNVLVSPRRCPVDAIAHEVPPWVPVP